MWIKGKSMNRKAILFDLDGTLLPMDQEIFTKAYFNELSKVICPYGYTPDELIKAVWKGTKAMIKNDGSCKNEEVFWKAFSNEIGPEIIKLIPRFEKFYEKEFYNTRSSVGENFQAAETVNIIRNSGRKVVLATNPIFPISAVKARLSWIGLSYEDFDTVTSYETESYCKPNPMYYIDILKRMELQPHECLMIGNDEREDMYAATEAGIEGYLVTDCIITDEKYTWNGKRGTFKELTEMVKAGEY